MFENKRYITCGIAANIPTYIQNILWYLVETMEIVEQDYLQVFELDEVYESGQIKQKIFHKQEQPPYTTEHLITVKKAVKEKVLVIDDGSYSTMLLAEEY